MRIKSIFVEIKDWCIENERDLVLISAFLLISIISFGLGMLWQKNSNIIKAPITINKQILTANIRGANLPAQANSPYIIATKAVEVVAGATNNASGLIYIASKKGKYYHLSECTGAKSIKPENKIKFKSKEEAERAGYKPAGNCPGLK